jgi:hypothetical protein
MGDKHDLWVKDGSLVSRPLKPDKTPYSARALLEALSMVRIETSDDGTSLKWNMGGANWASLIFAATFIAACPPPFNLQFFNAGWFEEVHPDYRAVAARLEQLLSKSDIHFSQRVYLLSALPQDLPVPAELRAAYESGQIPDGQSILCKVDFEAGTSNVERIGPDSLLGRVWGNVPISYPALSGHNFDRVVSQPYFEVLKTGKPHYDQVLASMIMPDGDRHWFNYHRVILPEAGGRSPANRVRVVAAQAPVEIALL